METAKGVSQEVSAEQSAKSAEMEGGDGEGRGNPPPANIFVDAAQGLDQNAVQC